MFGRYEMGLSCIEAGILMASLIPCAIVFFVFSKKIYYKLLGVFALTIFSLVLISSGTRGAWIAAFVSSFYVIVFSMIKKQRFVLSKLTGLFCLAGVLLIILYAWKFNTELNSPTVIVRYQSLRYGTQDMGFLERVNIWFECFKLSLKYPLGMGFRQLYSLGASSQQYPHSLYFGLLLTSGYIGAFGFIGFIIFLFKKMISYINSTNEDERQIFIAATGSTVAFLIYSIFEHPLYNATVIMPTMWIIWGTAMGLWMGGQKCVSSR